jgi:diguanylate cyclase (GGDEF)-like protein/PAS domain S-box-containing protein
LIDGGERTRTRARLEAATLNALHELAIASGTRGVRSVARLAIDHARALLKVDGAVIFSYDPDRELLVPIAETESKVPEGPITTGEGAIGLAFDTGLPVVIEDYQGWELKLAESAERGVVSALAVPLIAADKPVGALGVWTYEARQFPAEEEQLLTLFAAQVAPALEAAKLAQQRQDQARIFEALHQMGVATGGLREATDLARLCVERTCELLKADSALLLWWDQESEVLHALAESDAEGPEPIYADVKAGEGAPGMAFRWTEPVIVNDYPNWDHATKQGLERGFRSVIHVPLMVRDRAVGTLGVQSLEPRQFAHEDAEILGLLAAQIAPALDAAGLLEASEGQVHELRTLHDLAVGAGGMLDTGRLARLVVNEACNLLGVERAVLRVWEPQDERLVPLADSGAEDGAPVPGPPLKAGEGLAGSVFEAGRATAVEDYPRWPDSGDWGRREGFGSALMVPLISHQRAVGTLGAFAVKRRKFADRDLRVLSLLAAQVAPALEAARLAEAATERARIFTLLHQIAVTAGGVLEPGRLAALLAEKTRELMSVERVTVTFYDPESELLRVLADTEGVDDVPPPVRPGIGTAGVAFMRRERVIVDDYQSWDQGLFWARERGYRSAVAVPLLARDRAIGTILAMSRQPRRFGEDEVKLLSLLVAQIAPAIQGASLHADLAASERALRAIYDTAPVIIARNDLSGSLTWMNRAGRELFGYTDAELRQLGRDEILDPEDVGLDADLFPRLVAGEIDRYRLERRYLKKDGTRFWGDVTISLVRDSDGEPEFYYAMVEDITERKQAEAARQESEGRFRAVFDRAAIGIARLGLDGRIIEANPALETMLGRTERKLIGAELMSLVHADDRDGRALQSLARGETAEYQAELRYARAGAHVWGNTIASAVRGPGGDPLFLIAMVEDITLRKVHEAALEHRALHDPLTDLPNRNLLHDRLQLAIRAAHRDSEIGALLVMDLDGFKAVNDAYGHPAGDHLLKLVGERLRGQLRSSDTVARLGGDEFAVVLPDVGGEEGGLSGAAKLVEALRKPFRVEGHQVRVSASIGISLFPTHGEDGDLLMRMADTAMYAAKRSRAGCVLYEAEPARTA